MCRGKLLIVNNVLLPTMHLALLALDPSWQLPHIYEVTELYLKNADLDLF